MPGVSGESRERIVLSRKQSSPTMCPMDVVSGGNCDTIVSGTKLEHSVRTKLEHSRLRSRPCLDYGPLVRKKEKIDFLHPLGQRSPQCKQIRVQRKENSRSNFDVHQQHAPTMVWPDIIETSKTKLLAAAY